MREATILLVESSNSGVNSMASALQRAGLAVHVVQIDLESQKQRPSTTAEADNPEVAIVSSGEGLLVTAVAYAPDLIVFDASAMQSNDAHTCRRLRRHLSNTPIIHCRAAGTAEERTAEADVYLAHPFTPRKLINRIRALLPADDLEGEIVRVGDLVYYLSKRSVEVAGQGEHRLTPKLACLLEEFLRHPNELLGRHELMQRVWKTDYFGDTRTLDVHIRWVREVIEDNPAQPQLLKTVRGAGYIFRIPPKNR